MNMSGQKCLKKPEKGQKASKKFRSEQYKKY